MESVMVEDYMVNHRTMALIPVFKGESKTKIYEVGGSVLTTNVSPIHIMKKACLERGSSLQGRYDAVKHKLGFRQRLPVPVDQQEGIYAFPIMSAKKPENIWLFYDHVDRTVCDENGSIIIFYDGQQLSTSISSYIIEQQILKTGRCKTIFQQKFRNPIH
ncbi:competence protein ComK [Alteribacillus iranensis]|uniref:Competence protein ComK n=1 Tax=Alteribacillus iranensis TaxID=930128 RepID=A0A1I2EJA7_9BACI|nr:competence protein ComK [Alteribacillus iranensis]SFE92839.1 competence protein ComK [Alteribacillus iranensis]